MKKRLDRLMLCGLMVCALAVPAGLANGEEPDAAIPETQAPATQIPETPALATNAPTPEPTNEPTAEPTNEPAQDSTPAPTQEPGSEPDSDASSEPTMEPTLEPTLEPTPEQSLEPSAAPSATPSASPEPTAAPLPLPGSIDELVAITPEGTAQQENGVWKIQLSAPGSPVSFGWTVSGEASGYLVYVQAGEGEMRFIAETGEVRMELSSADYANGRHALYVGAMLADGNITWGKAVFELAAQQGGFPGGFPGGGRPSGSASMGAMSQQEQGFRVTPGEALTGKHASGTMNTTAYTCSEIVDSEEAITSLYLSSTQAEITLDNGAFFHVSAEDGKLILTPETNGECWQLSVLAMNTLADSGIERVVFHTGSTFYSLPTEMKFSGSMYASLRARGYVSKDMKIRVDKDGVCVSVADGIYSISDNGELVPCEE